MKNKKIILIFFMLIILLLICYNNEKLTNSWEPTGWFRHSGSFANRCNDGNYHNGYHYKYNEGRHKGNNLCGNSWCCKKKSEWFPTGWFRHSGSYANRCNDGNTVNGFTYKYNEGRHKGNSLCGNTWCCKKPLPGWEATGWFRYSGSNANRCNDGNYHNGYYYKYNEGRHKGYSLCGNSWCCKRKSIWTPTGWFRHSGSNANRCNDGKYHNGYYYKYNEGRHKGYSLCGNSWCCKRKSEWSPTGWFRHSGSNANRCNDGNYHDGYYYKYNEGRHKGNNLCGNSWCCRRPGSQFLPKLNFNNITPGENYKSNSECNSSNTNLANMSQNTQNLLLN